MTIVYSNTLDRFYEESPFIPDLLTGDGVHGRGRDSAQYRAWSNSLQFVQNMLMMADTPKSCGVLIEFRLPATSRRVDFIITGHDANGSANFVVIELKQWSQAEALVDKPGVVLANVAGSRTEETNHPHENQSQRTCLKPHNSNPFLFKFKSSEQAIRSSIV